MALSLRSLLGLKPSGKRARPQTRLRFEALESRLALSTLTVGPDAKDDYHSIQSAVTAAHAGDTIKVDPGTYVEQVTIGAGKDNLRIVGSDQKSIIQAPLAMTGSKAIVEVDVSQNVTIEKFTIQGPGSGPCDSIEYGVLVAQNGSATIDNNHITQIRDNPFSGCQNGVGILVGRASQSTNGSATISKNTIDNYQKGGIVIDNTDSSATIDHNSVVGIGPTAVIAQNGIQVSDGAAAQINHNEVSGNVYTPQSFASTGILLYQAGNVTVDHNRLSANDVGIYAYDSASQLVIDNNDVSGSTFDGIVLDAISGALVSHNTSNNNGTGIGLYESSTNNTISQNTCNNNSGPGIYVELGSTGNTFSQNKLKGNSPDAQDDSTGNTWTKNKGKTSSPPGLVS